MKCFKCHKEILKEEKHFIMVDMENSEEENRRDYVHQTCWNNFLQQLDGASNSLKKSNYLLSAMGKQMMKMGMLPDKEVEIC